MIVRRDSPTFVLKFSPRVALGWSSAAAWWVELRFLSQSSACGFTVRRFAGHCYSRPSNNVRAYGQQRMTFLSPRDTLSRVSSENDVLHSNIVFDMFRPSWPRTYFSGGSNAQSRKVGPSLVLLAQEP